MSEHQKMTGIPFEVVYGERPASRERQTWGGRESDSAYYERRAREELAFAAGRDNALAASLHRDLAGRYAQLAAAKRGAAEGS